MVTVLDLNKIKKIKIKISGILYIKEENFDCKYVRKMLIILYDLFTI